jgi:hypothetical protein
MRLAALAAMLAVAHGSAPAHAAFGRETCSGCGGAGGALAGGSPSMGDGAIATSRVRAAFGSSNPTSSETQSRCGCNRDPGNGHGARAGF